MVRLVETSNKETKQTLEKLSDAIVSIDKNTGVLAANLEALRERVSNANNEQTKDIAALERHHEKELKEVKASMATMQSDIESFKKFKWQFIAIAGFVGPIVSAALTAIVVKLITG